MSGLIEYRNETIYWCGSIFYENFVQELCRQLELGNQPEIAKKIEYHGVRAIFLNSMPETFAFTILVAMKRMAEETLEGKTRDWLPQELAEQESYLAGVREILFYTKQDLGLASALPPRRGQKDLVMAFGCMPYWAFESFLDQVIDMYHGETEIVQWMQDAIKMSEFRAPYADVTSEAAMAWDLLRVNGLLRAISNVAESVLQDDTPPWLQGPENKDGQLVYVKYVSSILWSVKRHIKDNEDIIAELQQSET